MINIEKKVAVEENKHFKDGWTRKRPPKIPRFQQYLEAQNRIYNYLLVL